MIRRPGVIASRVGIAAALGLLLAAATQPVLASCSPLAVPFTSKPRPGYFSYIYAAGWGPNFAGITYSGLPYDYFPALDTGTLEGFFWALGSGDPLIGVGDDNGAYAAHSTQPGVPDWITTRSDLPYGGYYGGYFLSQTVGWGTNSNIDNCITNNPSRCMCVLLTQDAVIPPFPTPEFPPQFMLASAYMLPSFAFEFRLDDNAPMVLAEIPRPRILASARVGVTNDVMLDLVVPSPPTGIYLQPPCDCPLAYLVKQFIGPRGQTAGPPDNNAASFTDLLDVPTPFDATVGGVVSECGAQENDVWLVTQLVAPDSGFATPFASRSCGPFCCGPFCIVPANVEWDCLDGFDNDCDGDADAADADCTGCTNGQMRTCGSGSDVGQCSPGTQTCSGGAWGACSGAVGPSPETCDGLDNDCDGSDDNGNPGGGAQCGTTDVGECSFGTMQCTGGTLVCEGNVEPQPEVVADDRDQNCDGFDDCYLDGDEDTYGSMAETITGDDLDCNNTPGEADDGTDCDDGSASSFPGSAPNDDVGACMEDVDGDDYGDVTPPPDVTAGTDCDDADSNTYPEAPEVSDGLDNQCPGDYGFNLIDENSGISGFFNPGNRNEYSWPPVTFAAQYEYLRSDVEDFATACVTAITANTLWVDGVDPPLGGVFYYINRPDGGSWGRSSSGERFPVCAP